MRHYEILLMIHPDRSVIVSSLIEQYKNVILMNNGIIHRLEDWGKRSLAYPIKKLYKAHYVLFNIEVVCKTMFELEDLFRFNDYIIRNMIVRLKKAITDTSPMMMKVKDESSNIVVSD